MNKSPLELYIHIPFCARKCAYCDFLSFPASEEVQKLYVERLLREIGQSRYLAEEYEAVTVFFGGGTPSILRDGQIERILACLRKIFDFQADAEITIEANPGTVTEEKLAGYRRAGVNRVSFGLQSADNRELQALGRIHTWEQFSESFRLAREAGFTNINIDVMSALPGQTVESYRSTLQKVLALEPEHISAYSLIIEKGTPFYERYAEHPEFLPSEDEEREMYYLTRELLRERGYGRYEISNYAREGFACRHNLGYWERTEYKGYGLGAASLLKNIRSKNEEDLRAYLDGHTSGSGETLDERAVREEYFFLGLRKTEGVIPGRYREHYEPLFRKLESQGLLAREGGRVRLTDYGVDVSNYVLAQFLDD